ncbi:hypothetical protein LTR36_010078 [Oleoguttula mirabilis]|uniref:Uncharacterized protein n=1 Tax=Oleoguttula mirabilis TaxID=1507867 RepID=A0AAV9JRW2_9PEZI|nr:hypothetical protein LTR36_010078 [Oleoguttula mirabilis]
MLLPQLPSGLTAARRHSFPSSTSTLVHQASASSLIRASSQSRSCWAWRRRGDQEYSSHLDPLYYRFTRYRALQTRAKLLEKLKRRGRYDWDMNQKPFFTPKHIRSYASHWNAGRPDGPPWQRSAYDKYGNKLPKQQRDAEDGRPAEEPAEEGHELSQREKEWKDRMEFMRKRIQSDPYEAVFGKRFEPFWSPLVPSWMREEMGLQGSSKAQQKAAAKHAPSEPNAKAVLKAATASNLESTSEYLRTTSQAKHEPVQNQANAGKKSTASETKPDDSSTARLHSSYTSTSWDSWTNKARRTEWDSSSGQTKRFEYDPISNRMIEVEVPKPAESVAKETIMPGTSGTPAQALATKRPGDMTSLINTPAFDDKALQIPVKIWSPVVVPRAQFVKRVTPVDATIASEAADQVAEVEANKQAVSPANLAKPAVLSKLPKSDLDFLSPDHVRAAMGKLKPNQDPKAATPAEKAEMERFFDENASATDAEVDAILLERELARFTAPNSRAAEWDKVDEAVSTEREPPLQQKAASPMMKRPSWPTSRSGRLETSMERTQMTTLQPAVERMQSKDLAELDDSAAHESTEVFESSSNIPKEWSKQADLLQANRVQRTASKPPFPMTRWIDDMNSAKAAHEASHAPSPADQAAAVEKGAKLQKANAMLESEVKEQKFRMQAHEDRYAHKIRSLRHELEIAYKQSAVHSEKHVERIRYLEAELNKATKAVGGSSAIEQPAAVQTSTKTESEEAALKAMQGEGDFCLNVTKYARADGHKWYKHPAVQPNSEASQAEVEKSAQKARDQALVRTVREIYEKAYGVIDAAHRQHEASSPAVAAVDTNPFSPQRRPAQVVEVESDIDLGEALAEHEKQQAYGFRTDDLASELAANEKLAREAEMAVREREAHEAQSLAAPEHTQKVTKYVGKKPKKSWVEGEGATEVARPLPAAKLVRDAAPEPVSAELASRPTADVEKTTANVNSGVQWEEPPVYKVLAYDPGNDKLTIASTTSNFTGSESPKSIPQALSQLYQPARFVPHFAELQQDGYQVIYGTRDLLVFKKVRKNPELSTPVMESAAELPEASMVDHGLIKPMENAMAEDAANFYEHYKPAPKVYDPTSIENGKLMPYENAMAQEAAHAYDKARAAIINPIDGTTRSQQAMNQVSTGNFASPTGFVNHDPLFLADAKEDGESAKKTTAPPADRITDGRSITQDEAVDYVHYPRVHRQEPVFSATNRKWSDRHERHQRQRGHKSHQGRRNAGAVKWALSVGVGAAALTYGIGVAAEAARREERGKVERWQEVLEGKRGRWE